MHRRYPGTPPRSTILPHNTGTPVRNTPGRVGAPPLTPSSFSSNINLITQKLSNSSNYCHDSSSMDYDDEDHKYSKRNGGNKLRILLIGVMVLFSFAFFKSMRAYSHLKTELQRARGEFDSNKSQLDHTKDAALSLEQRKDIQERENRRMETELLKKKLEKDQHAKKIDNYRKREAAILNQVSTLKSQIQRVSKRELDLRYGHGPHYVKFKVIFAGDPTSKPPSSFVIEMAPADLMPHSVLLFLDQVEKGLWNNTAFVHHADHIISATPTVYHTGISKRHEFEEAGLSSVAFQEYSDDFPHVEYTLGFSGRPGGPDFYISTLDNVDLHGPGGQLEADIIEEADPCFAKVVKGFNVVERIYQKEVEAPIDIHVVGIVDAQLIDSLDS